MKWLNQYKWLKKYQSIEKYPNHLSLITTVQYVCIRVFGEKTVHAFMYITALCIFFFENTHTLKADISQNGNK